MKFEKLEPEQPVSSQKKETRNEISQEQYTELREMMEELKGCKGILSLDQYIDDLELLKERQAENREIAKEAKKLRPKILESFKIILQAGGEIPSDIQNSMNELFLEPTKHLLEFEIESPLFSLRSKEEQEAIIKRTKQLESAIKGDKEALGKEIDNLLSQETKEEEAKKIEEITGSREGNA